MKLKTVIKKIFSVLFVVLFVLVVSSCNKSDKKTDLSSISSITKDETSSQKSNVDFDKLQKINPDIYAWISVPNTNIDYPVAQHSSDDNFYLHHNIHGKYEYAGTIFTEKKYNDKSFYGPNTILYGHNMTKGYMFENLHKFQDKEFFNQNEEFFIYTPSEKYTYKIVSAFQFNNYHLMYLYDFYNTDSFSSFMSMILNPEYKLKNIRENVSLSLEDRFVTLSTCLGSGNKYRYLVVGVLTNVEAFK